MWASSRHNFKWHSTLRGACSIYNGTFKSLSEQKFWKYLRCFLSKNLITSKCGFSLKETGGFLQKVWFFPFIRFFFETKNLLLEIKNRVLGVFEFFFILFLSLFQNAFVSSLLDVPIRIPLRGITRNCSELHSIALK